MICPECYAHVRRAPAASLWTRLVTWLTPYQAVRCLDCNWRGLLTPKSLTLLPYFRDSLLGWVIGVVIALTIAWFVVGDLEANTLHPTDASAEIKWRW